MVNQVCALFIVKSIRILLVVSSEKNERKYQQAMKLSYKTVSLTDKNLRHMFELELKIEGKKRMVIKMHQKLYVYLYACLCQNKCICVKREHAL
jgi:hypothetical protein